MPPLQERDTIASGVNARDAGEPIGLDSALVCLRGFLEAASRG